MFLSISLRRGEAEAKMILCLLRRSIGGRAGGMAHGVCVVWKAAKMLKDVMSLELNLHTVAYTI